MREMWCSKCGSTKHADGACLEGKPPVRVQRVVSPFCCEHAAKMWHLTDPAAPITTNFVGKCAVCAGIEPYSYHVPEVLWRAIVPEAMWTEVVCAKCFHELAMKRANAALSESGAKTQKCDHAN